MWIIKVAECYVGTGRKRLVDEASNAQKFRYKKEATTESIFWLGSFVDGTPYKVEVIKDAKV